MTWNYEENWARSGRFFETPVRVVIEVQSYIGNYPEKIDVALHAFDGYLAEHLPGWISRCHDYAKAYAGVSNDEILNGKERA